MRSEEDSDEEGVTLQPPIDPSGTTRPQMTIEFHESLCNKQMREKYGGYIEENNKIKNQVKDIPTKREIEIQHVHEDKIDFLTFPYTQGSCMIAHIKKKYMLKFQTLVKLYSDNEMTNLYDDSTHVTDDMKIYMTVEEKKEENKLMYGIDMNNLEKIIEFKSLNMTKKKNENENLHKVRYFSHSIYGEKEDTVEDAKNDITEMLSFLVDEQTLLSFFDTTHILGKVILAELNKRESLNKEELQELDKLLISTVFPKMLEVIALPDFFVFLDVFPDGKNYGKIYVKVIEKMLCFFCGEDYDLDKQSLFLNVKKRISDILLPWEVPAEKTRKMNLKKLSKLLVHHYWEKTTKRRSHGVWKGEERAKLVETGGENMHFFVYFKQMVSMKDKMALTTYKYKLDNFSFSSSARYVSSLRFLFFHCVNCVKERILNNRASKHIVQIKGSPHVSIASLHINASTEAEVYKTGTTHLCISPDGDFDLCEKIPVNDGALRKDIELPFLHEWPSLRLGLITADLGNDKFLVQLLSDSTPQSRPAIWVRKTNSKVGVCAEDMSCNFNTCAHCGLVKSTHRCICGSICRDKFDPHFIIKYEDSDLSYSIPFVVGQYVYFHKKPHFKGVKGTALEKGQKELVKGCQKAKVAKESRILVYIDAIKGQSLYFRVNQCDSKVSEERCTANSVRKYEFVVHFSDPRIEVEVQGGKGTINDLKIPMKINHKLHTHTRYAKADGSFLAYKYIAKSTQTKCTLCGLGPKCYTHGCNFCGSIQVGVRTKVDQHVPERFSLPLKRAKNTYLLMIDELHKEYNETCYGQTSKENQTFPIVSLFPVFNDVDISKAKECHDFLLRNITMDNLGLVRVKYDRGIVCVEADIFNRLLEANNLRDQLSFAEDTLNSTFWKKLSICVGESAPAWMKEKRDIESKKIYAITANPMQTNIKKDECEKKFQDMRDCNSIISKHIEQLLPRKLFLDNMFPYVNLHTDLGDEVFETPAISYTTLQSITSMYFQFSFIRKFSICSCKLLLNKEEAVDYPICPSWNTLAGRMERMERKGWKRGKNSGVWVSESLGCAGPFYGISVSMYQDVMKIMSKLDDKVSKDISQSNFFYDDKMFIDNEKFKSEEFIASQILLSRIHEEYRQDFDDSIYLVYMFLMRSWYALHWRPCLVSETCVTWSDKWEKADHFSFWCSFYNKKEGVFFSSFATQSCKRLCLNEKNLPVFEVLDNAMKMVKALFIQRPKDSYQRKLTAKKITIESLVVKSISHLTSQPEKIIHEFFHHISVLSGTRTNCTSNYKFCSLLNKFENNQKFSVQTCTESKCSQCRVLPTLFKVHRDIVIEKRKKADKVIEQMGIEFECLLNEGGYYDVPCRLPRKRKIPENIIRDTIYWQDTDRHLKNFVGGESFWADKQLDIWGEIVSFQVCEHNYYMHLCDRCMDSMEECRKDRKCVACNGKRMCDDEKIYYHTSKNTCIPCGKSVVCKVLRILQELRNKKDYKPIVSSSNCAKMNFYHRGSQVVQFND